MKIAAFIGSVAMLVSSFGVSEALEVGKVAALRGTATIHRPEISKSAVIKDPILLRDKVETAMRSRTKMVFVDESILTLGANSSVSIEKFIYEKGERGVSVFNLTDGYMRSIVGKNSFEVHTSTLVAAARGTVFTTETGMTDGNPFTTVTCFEGTVEVSSSDPSVGGSVFVEPGQSVTVFRGEPLPTPRDGTGMSGYETNGTANPDIFTAANVPPVEQDPGQIDGRPSARGLRTGGDLRSIGNFQSVDTMQQTINLLQ